MQESYRTLRLILGDQLNINHSWFDKVDKDTLYVLMECRSETDYVRHHIQKVVAFFAAMEQFAEQLSLSGHDVLYLKLDDPKNSGSIDQNVHRLVKEFGISSFEYQLPDEFRIDQVLQDIGENTELTTNAVDTEHFLADRATVNQLFAGKKQYLMETFYRHMRKRYQILMEPNGKQPLTGKWNYDKENRKKLPKQFDLPESIAFQKEVSSIISRIQNSGVETIGRMNSTDLDWPTSRAEGLILLEHFLEKRLSHFGRYQDAMTTKDPFLFHSKLSFLLNTKLLHPLEVVKKVEAYWYEHQDTVSIAQTEGFIRQIIGWREYMRGIYWAKMPEFSKMNFFDHQAELPSWFWSGKTKMKCLEHSINQSLDFAYAHHIQRLMVTGNFALLLGVDPDQVDEWYLGIYMDAIEWVEITNTRGMSQFADGGIVGTKPYVSSANYIHKMGDYCSKCAYDRNAKTGPKACPFNSLYWDFYDRHRSKLGQNPRIGMMYRVWDKRSPDEKAAILEHANWVKENVEVL